MLVGLSLVPCGGTRSESMQVQSAEAERSRIWVRAVAVCALGRDQSWQTSGCVAPGCVVAAGWPLPGSQIGPPVPIQWPFRDSSFQMSMVHPC